MINLYLEAAISSILRKLIDNNATVIYKSLTQRPNEGIYKVNASGLHKLIPETSSQFKISCNRVKNNNIKTAEERYKKAKKAVKQLYLEVF